MGIPLAIKRLGSSLFMTAEIGGLVCLYSAEDGKLIGSVKPSFSAQGLAICTEGILAFGPDHYLARIRLNDVELSIEWEAKFPPIKSYGFKGSIPVVETRCMMRTYNSETGRFIKSARPAGGILAYHADCLVVSGYKLVRVIDWQYKEIFSFPREGHSPPFECKIEDGFLTYCDSRGPVQIFRMDSGELVYEVFPQVLSFFVRAYFDAETFLLYLYEIIGPLGERSGFHVIDVKNRKAIQFQKFVLEIEAYEFIAKGRKFVTRSRLMIDVLDGTSTKY